MNRRRRLMVGAGAVVLALSVTGIALAALTAGSAEMEVAASVADPEIVLRVGPSTPGSPNFGPVAGTCFDGGSCSWELQGGNLTVTWDGVWRDSNMRVGFNGADWIWLFNGYDFPLTVTSLDLSGAPDFGVPGSGEPIEVRMVDPTTGDTDYTFPFDIPAESGLEVLFILDVNADTAEPGASYGPAVIYVTAE